MSNECTICYVTDLNFLLPSIMSAAQIRKFVDTNNADITIFTIGVDHQTIINCNMHLLNRGIQIVSIDERVFQSIDKERLSKTQTPLGTFGRFFMEELLPKDCQRIVYLDGDVWSIKNPSELINTKVPEGRFAAAEDTIYYRQKLGFGYTVEEIRKYFEQLNLKPENGYFNAGVFSVSRITWRKIAQEAFSYYLTNTDRCKHFDQSALNAVMGDRRLQLSSKWNFQTQLNIWRADRYVSPIIYHFNRYPKPWMGASDPWAYMFDVYSQAKIDYSALNLPLKLLSENEIHKYNISIKKSYSYLKWPMVTNIALKVMKFSNLEKKAWI